MAVAAHTLAFASDQSAHGFAKGHSIPVRAASVLFGFSFIWAGAGLWLVPGLDLAPSVLLAKMFLSVMMVTAGVGMTQIATDRAHSELHFDLEARQVHFVEALARGRNHVVRTIGYDDIAKITVSDSELVMLNHEGRIIVELPLEGPDARLDAIAQMRIHALAV